VSLHDGGGQPRELVVGDVQHLQRELAEFVRQFGEAVAREEERRDQSVASVCEWMKERKKRKRRRKRRSGLLVARHVDVRQRGEVANGRWDRGQLIAWDQLCTSSANNTHTHTHITHHRHDRVSCKNESVLAKVRLSVPECEGS
jgi:hypothetical protein